MNKITINGITKEVKGSNITVSESKNRQDVNISIDGEIIFTTTSRDIKITFEGDLASLNATHVKVVGNVMGDVDGTHINVSGDIIGNVDGTHVNANRIEGNVDAIHVNYHRK